MVILNFSKPPPFDECFTARRTKPLEISRHFSLLDSKSGRMAGSRIAGNFWRRPFCAAERCPSVPLLPVCGTLPRQRPGLFHSTIAGYRLLRLGGRPATTTALAY